MTEGRRGSTGLLLVSIANALLFGIGAVLIGGAAPFGKTDGVHFFVGDHGRLIEVSRAVYSYSWAHALSLLITMPLGIVAGFRLRRRPE